MPMIRLCMLLLAFTGIPDARWTRLDLPLPRSPCCPMNSLSGLVTGSSTVCCLA